MHPGDPPLHEMDPIARFSDRAADYVKYRPTYPDVAVEAILRGLGEPDTLVAADIGAGTGISARLLAGRGFRVLAVEPNAAMRAAADPNPLIVWREGTAEATGLPESSMDLVLCAQAFHWFRQPEAIAEFHRILRPNGRLALMWNSRDRRDPVTREFIESIHAVNGEHPAERRELDPDVIHRDGHFMPARLETFDHGQKLDRAGLIGRAASASYVPKEGEAFDELRRLLNELFDRHRGSDERVALRYVTKVYLAERR